jgi:predicted dehydrogenase
VVVGAGSISNAWLPPLKAEKVEVRGIVDLDVERAKAQAAKYELEAETSNDLKATLQTTQPDFVVDLTVPEAHCKVTCTALRSGCHVIGEKPMAGSMAEARRMVKAAEETGKLYMVSQSRRWVGSHQAARKMCESGKIGELTTANCDFYIGAHFGGFRDAMASPLILDMSIHHFDLVRCITGKDPVAVYCQEFNPKGSWYAGDVAASAIFEMTDGLIFTYRGSWCAEGCHTGWNGDWRFVGTKGTILMEKDGMPAGEILAGDDGFNRPKKPLASMKNTTQHEGQRGALRDLLAFLRTGQTPPCECHDNIKSLAMVFAAIESNKKGRRVPVRAL